MLYHIKPVLESFIWGGDQIVKAYHLDTTLKNVGMIYHLIALEGAQDCIVLETGEHLSAFYRTHPNVFCCNAPVFPLRLATSCSEKKMSYHLHPDNAYAWAHEGTMGKVSGSIAIHPNSASRTILFGNKAASLEEFKRLVEQRDWDNLFRTMEIKSEDFLHTPAGVIHGGGASGELHMVFATNSDISYRFYDYGRNDPSRKLHLQQVYDCVNIPEIPLAPIRPAVTEQGNVRRTFYYSKPGEYVAERLDVDGSGIYEREQFYCLTCAEGTGSVNGVSIAPAETILIPAHSGPIALAGKLQLYMISYLDEL